MELSLPEDKLYQALLNLILANNPPGVDIVHEILLQEHEDFDDMRTEIPTFFLELAIASPFALLLLGIVYRSSLIQPHPEDSPTRLYLKSVPRSN